MGIGVQLTNVLRDFGQDARSGRIYLPAEDLERFGVSPRDLLEDLGSVPLPDSLRLLLGFYAERARIYYDGAAAALPDVDRAALVPAEAMGQIYRVLLDAIQQRGFPTDGWRLSRPRRISIAASVWLGARLAARRRG